MERFLARGNIARFKDILQHPESDEQRATVEELLKEEEAKLAHLSGEQDESQPVEQQKLADRLPIG